MSRERQHCEIADGACLDPCNYDGPAPVRLKRCYHCGCFCCTECSMIIKHLRVCNNCAVAVHDYSYDYSTGTWSAPNIEARHG